MATSVADWKKLEKKIDGISQKIAGEVTGYRQEQEFNSAKLSKHDERFEVIEKHLHLPIAS